MFKRAIIAAVLALTPARWRESIAGDLEELNAGTLATLAHGTRVLLRLWIEEARMPRAPRRPRLSFRHAVRSLSKRPGYAAMVIGTLALGIGASAAVFTLANWLMFRSIPAVERPDRLVTIRLARPPAGQMTISQPEFEIIRERLPDMQGLAGSMEAEFNLAIPNGVADRVQGGIVSTNYFEVLGVRPVLGRAFSAQEPGIVISHDYWRTRMGSAPDAAGRPLLVNGTMQTVMGVAPEGFTGVSRSSAVAMWMPATLKKTVFPSGPDPMTSMRASMYVSLAGRLRDGADRDASRASLEAILGAIVKVHPRPRRFENTRLVLEDGLSSPAHERLRLDQIFSLMMAMVALLLVLTCANAGNLMLAAGSSRRVEIATRQALGASRAQIVAALLLESVVLSAAAGAVALLLAAGIGVLLRGTVVLPFLPPLGDVSVDWRVFGFAFAASMVCALAAGLMPALGTTRLDLIAALKDRTRTIASGGGRLRRMLTVAQVALSLALLVGALLMARSVGERRAIDPGFDPSPLLTFSIEPGLHGRVFDDFLPLYQRVIEHVDALPGVESAALGWSRPFGLFSDTTEVRAAGNTGQASVDASRFPVGGGYFGTMGIPIVAGREWHQSESAPALVRQTAVISVSLANRLFGSAAAAIGRQVDMGDEFPWRVIGVAGDARLNNAFTPAAEAIYQYGLMRPFGTIHVRTSTAPSAIAPALREAIRSIDPALPIYDLLTVRESLDRQMSEEILIGRLAICLAALAGVLAAVGLYGVLTQSVGDRRVEIGIRTALGAAPARVIRLVTRDALRMSAAGVAAGIALAVWLTGYLENRLFGVDRFDPITFAAAIAAVLCIAVVSTAVPAMRAARVDPLTALRS